MKKFILMLGLVLMIGVVAAHDDSYKERLSETFYADDGLDVVSRTTWTYYDNEDRHSTYDYRHGYSYRATRDYFEDKYFDRDVAQKKRHEDFSLSDKVKVKRDWDRERNFGSLKMTYYEYVPYMRDYEERECYVRPPVDKLFYIKC